MVVFWNHIWLARLKPHRCVLRNWVARYKWAVCIDSWNALQSMCATSYIKHLVGFTCRDLTPWHTHTHNTHTHTPYTHTHTRLLTRSLPHSLAHALTHTLTHSLARTHYRLWWWWGQSWGTDEAIGKRATRRNWHQRKGWGCCGRLSWRLRCGRAA